MTAGSAGRDFPGSIVLVGAGKMGGAMLRGWLEAGLDTRALAVIEPQPSPWLSGFAAERGVSLRADAAGLPPPAMLLLGVKPQALDAIAPGLSSLAGPDTLLVSILAGKTVADLRRVLPGIGAVVRAMPNLPASIGRGATGAFAEAAVSPSQRAGAQTVLACNGLVEWVADEALIDAVTALSGSGPAYVFLLAEAMAEAGEAAGLEPALAARLARATVTGAAALLEAGEEPATLRKAVTSPGGTTAAALAVLMAPDGMPALMRRAVGAAKSRAEELSG